MTLEHINWGIKVQKQQKYMRNSANIISKWKVRIADIPELGEMLASGCI